MQSENVRDILVALLLAAAIAVLLWPPLVLWPAPAGPTGGAGSIASAAR